MDLLNFSLRLENVRFLIIFWIWKRKTVIICDTTYLKVNIQTVSSSPEQDII